MAKHKTSELTGALLDAAVAKAEGRDMGAPVYSAHSDSERDWSPSAEWDDAGPVIEREPFAIYWQPYVKEDQAWTAGFNLTVEEGEVYSEHTSGGASLSLDYSMSGPTPLIAAMRAYVASKLGEEVDL